MKRKLEFPKRIRSNIRYQRARVYIRRMRMGMEYPINGILITANSRYAAVATRIARRVSNDGIRGNQWKGVREVQRANDDACDARGPPKGSLSIDTNVHRLSVNGIVKW